jgi:hypothetical protein
MTDALRRRLFPEIPAPRAEAAPAAPADDERPDDWAERNLTARWIG